MKRRHEPEYTVLDIATPLDQLTCWRAGEPREVVVDAAVAHNLTYIPVLDENGVEGIISRDNLAAGAAPLPLTADWLLATDTSILQLIRLFAQQPKRVFLVLQASAVVGLVAPADLNKIPARASVYLLVAHFELELARLLRLVLDGDADFLPFITASRRKRLQADRGRQARGDVELELLQMMDLGDIIDIARKHEGVRNLLGFASNSQCRRAMDLQGIRNRISHPARPLIERWEDLAGLNDACERLADLHQRIEKAIATAQDC
ncbi:MAG: hypothetical protein J4G17_05460 [Anaerolineae bacterium]|nr:hypothetical protein [Anaerolineae bacterium]